MRSAIRVVFLLVASLTKAAMSNETTADLPCRVRAWVRAPDLKAGEVIQGDVKIKLDGPCEDVSSYTLGLRFAERSWVKTRRGNVTLPVHPRELRSEEVQAHSFHGGGIYDAGSDFHFWTNNYGVNRSAIDQYDSEMKNPDLWQVREEERIAFETRYPLSDEEKPGRDVVKPFALLVPSTSYPPLFDQMIGGSSVRGIDIAGVEHICIYFVDVTFSNGTHKEIEAGYTSFTSPPEVIGGREPMSEFTTTRESVNVTATYSGTEDCPGTEDFPGADDVTSRDEFTLEIAFPDGRHLEQGSVSKITITSHQVGPGLQRPLSVSWVTVQVKQRRTWAAKHAADNKTAEQLRDGSWYQFELWPKADDKYQSSRSYDWDHPGFSQKGVIKNGTTFSTEAVTVQIEVPPHAYPPFEMYYQHSVIELSVGIAVRNLSEDASEPNLLDDSDEEYDWTPALREQPQYHDTEIVSATVPMTIYRKPEAHETSAPPLLHYLSPEARAPIFVDPSSVAELQQLTVKDRDDLTPLAQPKFNSKEGGDVVKECYWASRDRSSDVYYVANTWLRKVVQRQESADALEQHEALVVQA